MADPSTNTTFVDKTTTILVSWLNHVNSLLHDIFAGAQTKAEARTALDVYSKSETDAVAGSSDHGGLTGLSDDDHTQYILVDGSRAFSGSVDLGTNNITNVGTVDGRDVSADGTKLDGIESGATADQTAKNSIEIDADDFQLVGDTASPGADQVYGTDGAGNKGWKADPVGSTGDAWSDPVDSDIIPDTNATYDLGSNAARFAEAHVNTLAVNGSSVTAINDENDMASDSASALTTQQSQKAYVDLVRTESETASFTVSSTHLNKTTRCSHASGMSVTLPSNTTNNLPIGFKGVIKQVGDGQITFDDDSGASTLRQPAGFNLKTAQKWSAVYYVKVAADTWEIVGDLEYRTTAVVTVQLFDGSQDVTTGDGAGDVLWRVPSTLDGYNLVEVAAYVDSAGTTGTTDIQIHNVTDSLDMLSTKLTIDSGETDSSTAATAAVINTSNDDVATADKIRFDVDAVSTTAPKGLWVELQFQVP